MSSAAPGRVACLTPPGKGAIATIGVWGPQAWDTVRVLFRTRNRTQLPAQPQAGRFWLARPGTDIADEVVLAVKGAEPRSWIEAHCHGGREAVRLLLETFQDKGFVVCSALEFLQYTEASPLRALAAAALAGAPTVRTAGILLDQYHSAFARALDAITAALDVRDVVGATKSLDALAQCVRLGRHLTASWRVAVVGAPNVGKSSLVNAIAGFQRSVVAPKPGTTRDVVTVSLAVDGWPVELADTAGFREGGEVLEEAGIRLAQEAAEQADLCLWVLDASSPSPVPPINGLGSTQLILNKIDLLQVDVSLEPGVLARVSALTGEGIPELCAAIGRCLVPEPPPAETAVPFTDRLCDGVEEARRLLVRAEVEAARCLLVELRDAPVVLP